MNQSNSYISVDAKEIVISGIVGRFPNSDNLKELQKNLLNKNLVQTIMNGEIIVIDFYFNINILF